MDEVKILYPGLSIGSQLLKSQFNKHQLNENPIYDHNHFCITFNEEHIKLF